MFDIGEMVEQVIDRGGGGDGVSIFGEAREGITGGCLGLLMSAGFFFAFFFLTLAIFTQADLYGFVITGAGFPVVLLLCVAGMVSPFVGVLWGLRGGQYNVTAHLGCFGISIILVIGIAIALSL